MLLPGDTLGRYPGCFTKALTTVRSESCDEGQDSLQPFIQQSFRLSQYKAAPRVADFLFNAYNQLLDAKCISGLSYLLPLTQQQLGELLGLSSIHVSRTLKGLRPVLRLQNHQVHIDDPEHLTEMFWTPDEDDLDKRPGRSSSISDGMSAE